MIWTLINAILLIQFVHGSKILGVFHGIAYSHQLLGSKLLYELAARGHEITTIIPEKFAPKQKIKNYKTVKIVFDGLHKDPSTFSASDRGTIEKIVFLDMLGLSLTEMALNQTSVKNLIRSNEKFDLVIMEQFVNEALMGFCHHYKAPCVMLSTVGASQWTNVPMGNPTFPSYVPVNLLMYTSSMNFFERLHNSYAFIFATSFFHFYTLPKHNVLLQKYFPNAPDINDLYYNVSLMLLNSHVGINPAIPYLPNMIDIGGYHIDPPKELPKNLQEYLDAAKDGAIYFSMGSHIKTQTMPEEKLSAVINVLSKLTQKVLWKFDGNLKNKPDNVLVSEWFPQQEILAHPNVILFISHGGLLSTIESIYHGKPFVGIPVLGDQEMNVAIAELNGYAKSVPFKTLDEAKLRDSVNEILYNPKYAENARRRSKIMHDEPMKPLNKAVFWIEYVLRHGGAPHLRTSALNLRWYQVLCIDIIIFTILITLVFLYIFSKSLKLILGCICKKCVQKNGKAKND